jgi:hypothetical protein
MSRISSTIALMLCATLIAAARCDAAQPTAAASRKSTAASSAPSPAPARKKLTAAEREFAAAYVNAVNSGDINALRKLVAPEVVACFTKDTKPFLDHWLQKNLRMAVSVDYEATFAPYDGGLQTSPLLSYPAMATDTMQLNFGAGPTKDVTITREVTREKKKLYLVAPCLTPAGVANFQAEQKQRAVRIEQARTIYDKLEDPLRTQLRTMVKQNKMREAMQLCSSRLRIDAALARDVLLLLADREPD